MNKTYTIGRDTQCDIIINDQTDVISRVHAVLRMKGRKKITITDQSRNGTYINGIRMISNVEVPVSRNDVISFAHIRELDWSEVPGASSSWGKYLLVSALAVFILAGIGYGIYRQSVRPADPVSPHDENTQTGLPVQKDTVIRTDTVMKRDTVFIQPPSKKEEPPQQAPADSVKEAEKQKENEIVNPVY